MAATARDLTAFRQAQNDTVALAKRDLRAFWKSLDFDNPADAVRALEQFLPELIRAYGEVGASVAADFYDDLRDRSPAARRRSYTARMGNVIDLDEARRNVGWAVKPLFERAAEGHVIVAAPDTAKSLARVYSITDRLVKATARQTIAVNADRDPARPRYARVPSGPTTCAFCLAMASRGAVYTSEASALGADKYHGDCDCAPTPIWDGDDYPEGYDPEALSDAYKAAKRAADSGALKGSDGILSALRKTEGIR